MDKEIEEFFRLNREALDLMDYCKRRERCDGCPFINKPFRRCLIGEPYSWTYAMEIKE